jgi:excisionase family DNA binding protein
MKRKNKNKGDHKMLTEGLYTVNEAAEQTRLSRWTIWDLLKRGKMIRTKVAGKTFVRESELKKLIVDVPKKRK